MRLPCFLALLGLFVGDALAGGVYREFGRWSVGCDNIGNCAAFGMPSEDFGEPRTGMRIERGAGQDARISVRLGGEDIAEAESVVVDGKLHLIESRQSLGAGESLNLPVLSLLKRLQDAETVALAEDAPKSETISLKGLKAALLFIDENQGRVGMRDALVARGDGQGSKRQRLLPLVRAVNVPEVKSSAGIEIPEAVAKATIARYRATARQTCTRGFEDNDFGTPVGFPLGGGRLLLEMYCWSAAYQAGSVFFIYDPGRKSVSQAPFEHLDSKTGKLAVQSGPSISNADVSGGKVSALHKGRGVGGCGEAMQWQWDGAVFRLISYRLKVQCGYESAAFLLYSAKVRKPDGTIAPPDVGSSENEDF